MAEHLQGIRQIKLPPKNNSSRSVRRWTIRATVVVPLLITVIFAILTYKNPSIIDEHIETLLVDYRFKIRNLIAPPSVPDNILIVTIDEKSLAEYGRWPWSRKLQAGLIEKVFNGSPGVVAVDIFYPESESAEADSVFAETLKKFRDRLVIALGFEVADKKTFTGDVDEQLYDHTAGSIRHLEKLHPIEACNVLIPPHSITDSALFAQVYTLPDRDGKLRWETLYIKYGDEYFPSLALQTARIAMGITMDRLVISGGEGVYLGDRLVPADQFGRLHINYIGAEGSIAFISAADVLSGSIDKDIFKDKTVLIGTSAMATYDQKVTPFSANMSGVEKNATVVANIMDNNFMQRSPLYIDILFVLAAGIASLYMGNKKSALFSLLYFLLLTTLILIVNQTAFTFYNIRFNLVYPLAAILSIGTFIICYKYFIEEKRARDIKKMFSSYVTERVVNELIKNPEMAKLGGERREITVLFSDICSFTSFSEKHEPEEVVAMLNEYLTAMTEVVFRWEGTLDKFIGDAIVAFWGAPLEQDDHAERAVRCSLHMIKRLGELNEKWISEGKTPLAIGIGLNTGEVLVGNIGAEGKKMDYTVIGDHVNIGARVESLTRKYDTNILMTELPLNKIIDLVKSSRIGHISIKGKGNVVVKGKEDPIKIYEIESLDPASASIIEECVNDDVVHMKEK